MTSCLVFLHTPRSMTDHACAVFIPLVTFSLADQPASIECNPHDEVIDIPPRAVDIHCGGHADRSNSRIGRPHFPTHMADLNSSCAVAFRCWFYGPLIGIESTRVMELLMLCRTGM